MTLSTSSFATVAVFLSLLASAAPSHAQTAAADPNRTCRGSVMNVGWGASVRDHDGPCRPAEVRRRAAVRLAWTQANLTCPSKRSYLSGAIQVCNNPRNGSAPR